MSTTMIEARLADCIEEIREDGGSKYIHPETGAWVEIIHDDDPGEYPTKRGDSEMHVSYLRGCRYGNDEVEVPDDFRDECPRCSGTGSDPERWSLTRGWIGGVVASGSHGAMKFIYDRDNDEDQRLYFNPSLCSRCGGEGTIEHLSGEAWLRATQGAIAVYQFNTGSYGEATAFMWTDCDEYTTPADAVKAWAEEFNQWADGDCWGFRVGDSRGEEDACWGFIGREYIEQEAEAMLSSIVQDVRERVTNNIELGSN